MAPDEADGQPPFSGQDWTMDTVLTRATTGKGALTAVQLSLAATPQQQRRARSRGAERKLNADEEREVVRLYGQSRTRVPEIARRFGMAESSVYRILRRHGTAQLDRSGSSSQGLPRQRASGAVASVVTSEGASSGVPGQGPALGSRTRTRTTASGFRVRFEVEEVLEAEDVHDALRQAEARGATEVTAVSRME